MSKDGANSGGPNFEGSLQLGVTCSVTSELMSCKFNTTGSLLAAGTTNASVTVFQPTTGSPLYQLYSPQFERLPVTAVQFIEGNDPKQGNVLVVAYSSGHVRHWYVSTGQCFSSIKEERQTLAAAVAPDGLGFATAGSDNKVYIYDESTMKLVKTLESSMSVSVMDGHVSRVFALAYHPSDSRILLSAGWDDTVQFWDVRENHSVRKISGPHICGDALCIEPTTFNIATGSWRYQDALQIWDFQSGKLLSTLQPELKSKIYSVCWNGGGTLLAGGTQKHQTILVNSRNDKVIGRLYDLEHGVYSVDYCPEIGVMATAAGTKIYTTHTTSTSQTFLTQED